MAVLDRHEPTMRMLTYVIIAIAVVGFASLALVHLMSKSTLRKTLQGVGVAINKVTRAAKEIERKTFHIMGLLVPLIHLLLLENGFSHNFCAGICWCITVAGWSFEFCRLAFPAVREAVKVSFMGKILREKEHNQLTGSVWFSLGCTLAISLFPPGVAMTSILYLVLGDMTAALIGVSFGGDVCTKKIGRQGKKSVEGSVAMFTVCFVMGLIVYNEVHLREYAVFFAALVATLTELYEPFGLNDNLTIPVFTSLSLTWGLMRIQTCTRTEYEVFRYVPSVWENLYNHSFSFSLYV